ncbi:MAG: YraN family protein [Prevotella sp.]|jgi:putative endonuclease|nr:YraN family protein [Prevotella sp.]MCI1742672.1 YraN family protein [Prevotella sp.]
MSEHNERGVWGEELASSYLRQKGYTILDRDWHQGKRDLDIVALDEDGQTLVFVEVKTRRSADYQNPEMAVDDKKICNLAYAADSYIKSHKVTLRNIRFDIISVIGQGPQMDRIDHIQDAFNPLLVLGRGSRKRRF